jgi:tRNA(Leu) C34 or U34 (ribose-2'-O)-methylase TrmL
MHGTRSLNLATAVAIVLFEAVRQNASLASAAAPAV